MLYNINDLKENKIGPKGAVFKLLGYNPGKNGRAVGPSVRVIPSKDTIFVPKSQLKEFKGTPKEAKELVEVIIQYFANQPRIVKDVDTGEPILRGTEGTIVFRNGYVRLEPKDMRLYNYLSWSNYNKNNEHRDKKSPLIFEEEIPNQKIQEAYLLRKKKTEAINLAESMEDKELKQYAASLGIFDTEIEVVRAKMTSIAEAEPDTFVKGFDSGDRYFRALINEALEVGVIEFVTNTGDWNRVMPNKSTVIITRVPKGKDHKEGLIDWLSKDTRGTDKEIQVWIDEKNGKEPKK